MLYAFRRAFGLLTEGERQEELEQLRALHRTALTSPAVALQTQQLRTLLSLLEYPTVLELQQELERVRSARAAVAVQRESEGGAMDEDGDGDEEDNGGWRAVVIAELAEVFQRFPSPVSLFDHEMQRPLAEEELKDRALSWPVTSFFQVVNDFQMEVAVDWKEDSSSIHSSFAVLASRFRVSESLEALMQRVDRIEKMEPDQLDEDWVLRVLDGVVRLFQAVNVAVYDISGGDTSANIHI